MRVAVLLHLRVDRPWIREPARSDEECDVGRGDAAIAEPRDRRHHRRRGAEALPRFCARSARTLSRFRSQGAQHTSSSPGYTAAPEERMSEARAIETAPDARDPVRPSASRWAVLAAALLVLAGLVYWPSFAGGPISDDMGYLMNPWVTRLDAGSVGALFDPRSQDTRALQHYR